ncbi:MAG: hypothetical protein V1694_04400 [Candidatus Eisenbacteria bacterium]
MRLSVFLFFVALYVATTAGHIYTVDSYLTYNVTQAIARHGTLAIPKFMMTVEGKDRRQYSKLGIGENLVSLPLYWIGSLVEYGSPHNPVFSNYSDHVNIPDKSGVIVADAQQLIKLNDLEGARVFFTALTNAFVTALVCLLFWGLLRHFGLSRKGALWGASLLGFATPFWVYSRDFFAEPLFAVCLLGSLLLLVGAGRSEIGRRMLFAGLASGLGILTRASFLPIAVVFAAYLVLSSGNTRVGARRAMWFALGCAPGVAILGLLNFLRFGDVFLTGYHTAFDKGFSLPLAKGLWWNLASPYRSIFLYAPAVVIFALGLREFVRRYRAEAWLMVCIIAYTFAVYSKWWAWHGGWCWGPRFLLPVIPLLLLPGLVAARTKRWLVVVAVILGILGFGVQTAGVLINYTAPYDYWIKIKKLDWAETNIQQFSPIAVHLKALFATSPRLYDLWIIQASKVIGLSAVWIILALFGIAGFAGWRIVRPARKA